MFRGACRAVTKRVATSSAPSSRGLVSRATSGAAAFKSARTTPAVTGSTQVRTALEGKARAFSATPAIMATQKPQVVGKTEADETAVRAALETLLAGEDGKGTARWTVTANGLGIERSFKFKNFTKTWDFMTAVALQCKLKNHHPEWSNVYSTTFIRWTTHNPGGGLPPGLTVKDTELAVLCDELARAFGEVVEDVKPAAAKPAPAEAASANDNGSNTLSSLADRVTDGDCGCGPPGSDKKT